MSRQQQTTEKTTNAKPIPHIPPAVQGSYSGRAQGEAAGEADSSKKEQ
jgi:hypothetical protein